MSHVVIETSAPDRVTAGRALQPALTDLVELYLQTKQLHWNVVGPGFRSLHEALDGVAADLVGHTDEVAERMRVLGGVPTTRTTEIATSATLGPAPAGEPSVPLAVTHLSACLRRTVGTLEEVCTAVEAIDPPTVDVLRTVVLTLDRHAWLLGTELGA